MIEILITAGISIFFTSMYLRAYRSDDEKYSKVFNSPHLKPSSLLMTRTHTALFVLPPVFGAAMLFLTYQKLGGEINFISIFLLLLAIVLGAYFLRKKFNDHKQAQAKRSQPNPRTAPMETTIFTREPLSPEKYRSYRRWLIIKCLALVLVVVGVFIGNMVDRNLLQRFEDASKASLAQDLAIVGVNPTELSPASTDCRSGRTFIYTNEYLMKYCTTYIETTTKRLDFEAAKEKLLQNSWQLTKEEDLGKKDHIWSKRADFQKAESCLVLLENDGPQTTMIRAFRGALCTTP